jgi:hypothetical protein
VLAALIPLTVPNLIRDGSSVNNDSLLICTTSLLIYLLSRVLTGDLSRRTSAWIAVVLAAALFTKGLALVLPPVVLGAYLIGLRTTSDRTASNLRRVGPPLLIAASGAVVGGLWWLRNVIDYGTIQVNGYGAGYNNVFYGKPDNRGTLSHFLPAWLTGFTNRVWDGIGLPDTPSLGPLLTYGWLTLTFVGVIAALAVRSERLDRIRGALLVAIPIFTIFVVAVGAFGTYRHWSHSLGADQGRYIYNAFVAIAALTAIGWMRVLDRQISAALGPIVFIGAVATNLAAWVLMLGSWYEPVSQASTLGGLRGGVDSLLRWSPLPDGFTLVFVVVLPVLTGLIAFRAIVREWRRSWQPMAASPTTIEPSYVDSDDSDDGEMTSGLIPPSGRGSQPTPIIPS